MHRDFLNGFKNGVFERCHKQSKVSNIGIYASNLFLSSSYHRNLTFLVLNYVHLR